MADQYFSAIWRAIAPGLGNHLWQSTLVATAATLLTLLLRKQHARARYWIWLAASVKFLIPFSFLVEIGDRLAWRRQSAQAVRPALYFVVEQISQPFTKAAVRAASSQPASVAPSNLTHLFPWLVAVWFAGFIAVLLVWTIRWHRISKAVGLATPLHEGREVGILRRVERAGGLHKPIAFLLSRASLEPGVFGIVRPVLIWPEGISQQLQDAHLEAILAHEVWHVRRRDNLAAAFHMLVEASFWFYPLVWWLGARLIEERERACDEEVLGLGSDRQVYAESILKVCEFCLGSPLPCVSGVTGADLKKRMVRIMSNRMSLKLDFARKLLLTTAAFLAIAIPVTFGLFHATPSRAQSQAADSNLPEAAFSSVSIKPSDATGIGLHRMMFNLNDGSFVAQGATLQHLIQMAFHVQNAQISGGLDLLTKARFDIDAKLDPSFVAATREKSSGQKDEGQAILKSLLANQFKLAAHFENRTLPAYDLVVDSSGAKLQEVDGIRIMQLGPGEFNSQGTPMDLLTVQLSQRVDRPIVDKTGLKGSYAFNLHWTPDPSENERFYKDSGGQVTAPAPEANGPSLFTALHDQLGLKLVPHTEPVQVLVIDHVEVPTAE